jgi:copper chaperone CopZ
MKCAKCSGSVEKALKATAGVEKVEVSLQRNEAVVEYDDAKVTEAKLHEVINGTGFKAVEEKPDSQ